MLFRLTAKDFGEKVKKNLSEWSERLDSFLSRLRLGQADSARGASVSASAALRALLGVNRILVALGDSSYGTLVNTCAACNTVVTNYVSHSSFLLLNVCN